MAFLDFPYFIFALTPHRPYFYSNPVSFNKKRQIWYETEEDLFLYVMRCAIWYHLYNLKNVKNTHGGVLILVKAKACNFTEINTPPWMFFTFLKLY